MRGINDRNHHLASSPSDGTSQLSSQSFKKGMSQPLIATTTEDLASAAQGGSPRAFSELVARCERFVKTQISSKIKQHETVEDLSQEVWLNVSKSINSYDSSRPFLPWLSKIISNKVVDHLRPKGQRFNREMHTLTPEGDGDRFDVAVVSPGSSPAEKSIVSEATELLGKLVQAELAADVGYLAHVFAGQLTISQVAAIFDMPEGTVKSQMHRYKARIKKAA